MPLKTFAFNIKPNRKLGVERFAFVTVNARLYPFWGSTLGRSAEGTGEVPPKKGGKPKGHPRGGTT